MAFCTKCGGVLSDNASFCMNCGAAVQRNQITVNLEPFRSPEYQSAQPVSQSTATVGRGRLIKHITASDNYLIRFTTSMFRSGCLIILSVFLLCFFFYGGNFIRGFSQMGLDNDNIRNILLLFIVLGFLSICFNAGFLSVAKRNELQIYENSLIGTSGDHFTLKSFEIEYKNISSVLVNGTKKLSFLEIKARAAGSPELYTYICYIKNPRKAAELINSLIN